MTIEQLKRAHNTRPFKPFSIRMADGRQFKVPHPDFLLAPHPQGRTVVVADTESDTYSVLDLLLMTELEFQEAGKSAN